jgi:UDP-N-acetylmuramoyl-L-alanyl-D-glutamate--2,6-diaminopimelate ligase
MRLDALIAVDAAGEAAGVEITGLAYDSREVAPGDLFFCVSGFRSDGHLFAPEAVRAGAAALVVERPLGLGVPEVLVSSARAAMAPAAARFYGEPARELRVVGVTGTNGKTTTAYLVRALLEADGVQCGLLGTVKSVIGGEERQVARTTPEAIDLQEDLRAMLDGGDGACAMEVSSHALELGRVDAVPFAAAIFTNLTQDHLDFHAGMEEYFQAKRLLFVPGAAPAAGGGSPAAGVGWPAARVQAPAIRVVNVGDSYGRRLAAELNGALTFAVDAPADYSATDVRCGFDGCSFTLRTPAGTRELSLPLPGRFNVANALGALAAVHALGVDLDVLVAALERGVRVPGRFEPVDEGQDFAVLVDYAHTPDSLENVLGAARELVAAGARGRVVCVFGAGGDRDRGKRPLMGEIAARLADVAIVTSDNPRSEDPQQIIEEILDGVRAAGGEVRACSGASIDARAGTVRVSAIADRQAAIAAAIAAAGAGDVVVIAGKGHEQGQEFADGRKLPFDDVAVARAALQAAALQPPADVSTRARGGAETGVR